MSWPPANPVLLTEDGRHAWSVLAPPGPPASELKDLSHSWGGLLQKISSSTVTNVLLMLLCGLNGCLCCLLLSNGAHIELARWVRSHCALRSRRVLPHAGIPAM